MTTKAFCRGGVAAAMSMSSRVAILSASAAVARQPSSPMPPQRVCCVPTSPLSWTRCSTFRIAGVPSVLSNAQVREGGIVGRTEPVDSLHGDVSPEFSQQAEIAEDRSVIGEVSCGVLDCAHVGHRTVQTGDLLRCQLNVGHRAIIASSALGAEGPAAFGGHGMGTAEQELARRGVALVGTHCPPGRSRRYSPRAGIPSRLSDQRRKRRGCLVVVGTADPRQRRERDLGVEHGHVLALVEPTAEPQSGPLELRGFRPRTAGRAAAPPRG
jgi:hypothetical protein